MSIKKGDVYNGKLLQERIADKSKPDGEDLTNLYQNNGYLFSNINAVEVKTATGRQSEPQKKWYVHFVAYRIVNSAMKFAT